jgi:hypothetical protein
MLERLGRDKRSNSLSKGLTYSRKFFYNIGPCSKPYKTFYVQKIFNLQTFCFKEIFSIPLIGTA